MLLSFKKTLLILIVVLAFLLRFINLGSIPPGLTWDEAALGYNAYSILQTGRDEYGAFLPLTLKSFGDYKPAFYAYTVIPFIATLGLNEMAVRLPSVIAGVLLVITTYFLMKLLFDNEVLALFSALAMAISPLAIQFSRPAFESNMAVLFNLVGFLFLVKGQKNAKYYYLTVLFFGLSLITYQASKIFVPMLIFGSYIFLKEKIKFSKTLGISLGLLLFIVGGILISTFLLGQGDRLSTQNFFAYTRSAEDIEQISKEDNLSIQSFDFQILHGEWFAYKRGLVERYLVYFSPKMLFVDGDYSPRHRVPDLGVLNYYSLVFIILGFVYLWKVENKNKMLIFLWLVIAPIPAVLSRDLISMVRALNLVVPFTLLEGAGFYFMYSYIFKQKKVIFYLGSVLISFIVIFNLAIYMDRYFVHAPKELSEGWLYGYKQVFESLKDKDLSKYNKVVFTDIYGQPYIYYVFYNKYPPAKLQEQIKLDQPTVDVGTVRKIDNIEFRHVFWPNDRGDKNSLFVGNNFELPDQDVKPFPEYKILSDINYPDGLFAFRVVETK